MSSQRQPKTRRAAREIKIDSNVRCLRIYPVEATSKDVATLQTVGIKLSQDQAIHLARVLLAAAQDWQEVEVTGYRFERRRTDGSYRLTITSGK
jgi:hypothetical protein